MNIGRLASLTLLSVLLGACSHGGSVAPNPGSLPSLMKAASINPKIKHVVIIIQENRSVDNMFNGFPEADTVTSGQDSQGKIIPLVKRPLWQQVDPAHTHMAFEHALNDGMMNGFDEITNNKKIPHYSYSYTDPADVRLYWKMAHDYTFADRMFQSNSGRPTRVRQHHAVYRRDIWPACAGRIRRARRQSR